MQAHGATAGQRFGGSIEMTPRELRDWLANGDRTKPLERVAKWGGKMKKPLSFGHVRDHIHGLAAPGASHRVDMKVSGNPSVIKEATELGNYNMPASSYRKRGGRTEARK